MKHKFENLVLLVFFVFSTVNVFTQVGIGTTNPDASSGLDIDYSDKGFLPPRMTTAQRNAIENPADGLIIFNTTNGLLNYYNGDSWYELGGIISPSGTISGLDCANVLMEGTLTQGVTVTGVSVSVPYTGGNGQYHPGQTVSSTGVTGLTATLNPGVFNNGNGGTLNYNISGFTYYSGIAEFALNIGSQTCNLQISVAISPYACDPSSITFTYNGATVTYGAVFSAGNRCWLDRNLGASQVADSSLDEAAYGDLFQWGRLDDGHQVRTSSTTTTLSEGDYPGHGNFIVNSSYPNDWRSPQNNNLWQGTYGTNNPCPDGYRLPTIAEWNTERLRWGTNNAIGAFASPLKLTMAGGRGYDGYLYSDGTDGHYYSSSVSGSYSLELYFTSSEAGMYDPDRGSALSVRCIKDNSPAGNIGSLDCGAAIISGSLTEGIAASGVSASVPYSAGNGCSHPGQTVISSGVTGLTAFLYPGIFNNGTGNLIYTVTGTPVGSGTATFALDIGGQTCNLELSVAPPCPANVTFTYNGSSVTYGAVTSAGGRCWLDRNLGATQVATGSNDAAAYGHLFQWGRLDDGHQVRTSPTTTTLSNSDVPGHGNFIKTTSNPYDWRSPQNDNLWQGVNGINNPCPAGFRLPTETEWNTERLSWSSNNAAGAYASPLKLTLAGYRWYDDGLVTQIGTGGYYWSNMVSGYQSKEFYFTSSNAGLITYYRGAGLSVRCIRN